MKNTQTESNSRNPCPCESGKPYKACCEPFHKGSPAPTAEALMRSRYTAFVLQLEDYLLSTWHPETRPTSLGLAEDPPTKWLGLQIKHAENTSEITAIVEFVARYKIASKATRLHETSQFERIDGRWYYLNGEFNA
ncbi:YchJ family metal-binding protein [Methylotenera sp.]|uniref:YchJ family protein n=1 Tax=Methylotenera sp. TaxID=2051956 RepID=UPI0024888D1F|nr:YchJ family metal-binding protein [Methylotenera sp.]MDI1362275.1 YchJ family metal-binding protein [Methylotenera sp.]